jgi:hypothetical protein
LRFTITKLVEYLVGLLLIIGMLFGVLVFDDSEILLPEIAAMTAGMWIYHEDGWIREPRKIITIPTITASIGFFINRLPLSYLGKILLTTILMLLILRLAKLYITPALATGLFPIIVNATHWSFLISIIFSTVILMVGVLFRKLHEEVGPAQNLNFKYQYVFLTVMVAWILIADVANKPHMAAIPPIIVVFFEVLQKPAYPIKLAGKHILVLTLSASLGFVIHLTVTSWLVSALIALPLVFILLSIFKIKLPAAYAFPLLALILPADMFKNLPVTVLLASLFFFSLAFLYKHYETKKSPI